MDKPPTKRRGPVLWLVDRPRWLKARTWRFWVVVGLPFLYLASFGPACRCVRPNDHKNIRRLAYFYYPLRKLLELSPPAVGRVLWPAYRRIGGETEAAVFVDWAMMNHTMIFDPPESPQP